MQNVLLLGAGKIGSLISELLASCGDYHVHLGDITRNQQCLRDNVSLHQVDATNKQQLASLIESHSFDAVISGLPYFCNIGVVDLAYQYGLCYFDLTEDVEVTRHVIARSRQSDSQSSDVAYVPQCGLAPGFISIVAQQLINSFEKLDMVKMRVGALPVNQNNTLKYSLTWSTDGLINEYGNTCYGIENYKLKELLPLEGYETISIDGLPYEAFNTSGGLGTLADTYTGKLHSMNYKTLRYPGHCEMVRLLMNDLKLNDDRETLKRILENSVPKTRQDVVIIYVSVSGYIDGQLYEENYLNKIYPHTIGGELWSAIQVSTATSLCAVFDIVMARRDHYHGLVRQEDIILKEFLENRFGVYYQQGSHS